MLRLIKLIIVILMISLIGSACGQSIPLATTTVEEINATPVLSSSTAAIIPTLNLPTVTPTLSTALNDYLDCGSGELIEVPYFFKDANGMISPTQIVRVLPTSDNVRRYVSVISCLAYDKGWPSNPAEVENGYENEIIFFDKFGKGHKYRIIIGGHYVAPYDPAHKDLTASLNGIDEKYYDVDDWIEITRNQFTSNSVRQIGVDIYLEDSQGNLSKVLREAYQFKDTNLQIEAALTSGEGYPEQVPDGFFLFATKTWLITPD